MCIKFWGMLHVNMVFHAYPAIQVTWLARCTTGSSPLLHVQFHSIVTLTRAGLNNVIKVIDVDNHRQNQTMACSQQIPLAWAAMETRTAHFWFKKASSLCLQTHLPLVLLWDTVAKFPRPAVVAVVLALALDRSTEFILLTGVFTLAQFYTRQPSRSNRPNLTMFNQLLPHTEDIICFCHYRCALLNI